VAPGLLLLLAAALAPAPDLAGTWKLDPSRSRVDGEIPFAGLIGAGAPSTLHLSQARNGTLIVESQINESHVRVYVPGRSATTPVFVGPPGTIAMTSRWEGQKLVSEGRREAKADPSAAAIEIREVIGLAEDGRTLEIEITLRGSEGTRSSTLRYGRIRSVGACDSWPTPCKR
jgi:hypothetical protein